MKTKFFPLLASGLLTFASHFALAGTGFTNLTSGDYDKVTKEFSGNFVHPSVSGPSGLGSVFGFELAVVGAQTASPDTDSVVKKSNSTYSLSNLYTGGLLVAATVPFGFTGEVVVLPKTTVSDSSFQMNSLGLKWNASDVLGVPLVNLALRGIYTTSELSFNQTISGLNATVTNKNTVTGLQLMVSPKLPFVEPYAGIGVLSASNTLSVTGTTGTIFDSTLTTGQSSDTKASSTQIFAGVNAKLLLFSLGAEYSKAFDASRYAVKLGFAF